MLISDRGAAVVNDQTIELIAKRVIEALRDDLEAIAAELTTPTSPGEQLTVGQVARRLGVEHEFTQGMSADEWIAFIYRRNAEQVKTLEIEDNRAERTGSQ